MAKYKFTYIIIFLSIKMLLPAQDTLRSNNDQNPPSDNALTNYNKNIQLRKRQHAFAIAGIPCFAGGLATLAAAFMMSTAISANNNNDHAKVMATVGGTLITATLAFEITSIVNGIKRKKRSKKIS